MKLTFLFLFFVTNLFASLMPIYPLIDNETFNYFFSLVFNIGFIIWGITAPLSLFKDRF